MKKLILALLCVTSTCMAAVAVHTDSVSKGSEGVGGGNTINGELIETYGGHSVTELDGFQAAVHRLRGLVPYYADLSLLSMKKKNVYLIPTGFDKLPVQSNYIVFDTELPCYQTVEELFCDTQKLKTMSALQLRNLFIHEIFVDKFLKIQEAAERHGLRASATISDVRAATSVVLNTLATADQLGDTLMAHHLLEMSSWMTTLPAEPFNLAGSYQKRIEMTALNTCAIPNPEPNITDYRALMAIQEGIMAAFKSLNYEFSKGNEGLNRNVVEYISADWILVNTGTQLDYYDNSRLCPILQKKYRIP